MATTARTRRGSARLLVVAALVAGADLACSDGRGEGADATSTTAGAPAETAAPPLCAEATTPDATTGSTAPGGAVGNDPYTAVGARQVPTPETTTTALPPTPVSIAVVLPPNPDEHIAAGQVKGAESGPVPEPRGVYEPGKGDVASSTSTTRAEEMTTSLACIPGAWP